MTKKTRESARLLCAIAASGEPEFGGSYLQIAGLLGWDWTADPAVRIAYQAWNAASDLRAPIDGGQDFAACEALAERLLAEGWEP